MEVLVIGSLSKFLDIWLFDFVAKKVSYVWSYFIGVVVSVRMKCFDVKPIYRNFSLSMKFRALPFQHVSFVFNFVSVVLELWEKQERKSSQIAWMASDSNFVQAAIPRFDGHYDHWSILMENFLRSKEYWPIVESRIQASAPNTVLLDA